MINIKCAYLMKDAISASAAAAVVLVVIIVIVGSLAALDGRYE